MLDDHIVPRHTLECFRHDEPRHRLGRRRNTRTAGFQRILLFIERRTISNF